MKPILFSTEMVKAILAGRKTMTRRIIKPKYSNTDIQWKELHSGRDRILVEMQNDAPAPVKNPDGSTTHTLKAYKEIRCPYGMVGDILWVRESFGYVPTGKGEIIGYKATHEGQMWNRWRPSIHMPKEACRLFLKIADIRVERLHDITWQDIEKEGIRPIDPPDPFSRTHGELFETLWIKINGPESWQANPWVWVVSFEVTQKPC